jgi:hypothetical protein
MGCGFSSLAGNDKIWLSYSHWLGACGVRRLWLAILFLSVAGCGTSYPEIKDYCPALGRALTNEERILKGLEYYYNEDERLLRDFPKGAKASSYWVPNKLDHITKKLKPPFVPEHFQIEKRAAQIRERSFNSDVFLKDYYKQFPDCCAVVEPAYRREKWPSDVLDHNLNKDTTWNKDVWVRQEYPFRESENVQSRGELSSNICGEVTSYVADRG